MTSLAAFLDDKIALLPHWAVYLIYIALLLLIASVAFFRKWLTLGGTFTAVILGFLVLYMGGFPAFTLLLFFFLTGSLIAKANKKDFSRIEKKSGRRDFLQVIANGLPSLLGLLIFFCTPYKRAGEVAFASALAEAMADTWASEIGKLSKNDPVSIITRTKVPKGISGGVSSIGFIGAFVGSFLMALLFIGSFKPSWSALSYITLAGFFGSVLDSVLGATLQVHYRDKDGFLTERDKDIDGKKNDRARGLPFITNDTVNFISSLFSMTAGFLLSAFL